MHDCGVVLGDFFARAAILLPAPNRQLERGYQWVGPLRSEMTSGAIP